MRHCGSRSFEPSLRHRDSVALAVLLASTLSPIARAQHCPAAAQSSIATDRPQVTNSSVVVPCGTVQLENGLQESASGGQRSYDLPETAIRLGVGGRTELRLTVPNATIDNGSNGFDDLGLGFKRQFGPVHGFDFSVIPSLTLPTGSASFSSHGYDPSLQLPWSRGISKNWTAAGMLSAAWPTVSGRHTATGQASVYFDRQLLSTVDAYVEYAGAFPRHGGPQHLVDLGVAFKPTPHQQLDLHYGVGLSAAAADHTIGVGYSVRFPAWHGSGSRR